MSAFSFQGEIGVFWGGEKEGFLEFTQINVLFQNDGQFQNVQHSKDLEQVAIRQASGVWHLEVRFEFSCYFSI